jgi:hypothetical protein
MSKNKYNLFGKENKGRRPEHRFSWFIMLVTFLFVSLFFLVQKLYCDMTSYRPPIGPVETAVARQQLDKTSFRDSGHVTQQ